MDQTCIITNIPNWHLISAKDISNRFQFEETIFLNDFEANAFSLLELKDEELICLTG